MDSEVGGHLLDRHTRTSVPRHPHDVLAELFRIRLGHSDVVVSGVMRAIKLLAKDPIVHAIE